MDQVAPTPQPAAGSSVAPNQFDLRGKDIQVSFSATSFTGVPLMQYRDRRRQVNARGDEIRQVDVGIGTLVTIELQSNAADAGGILFSVLIPHALLTNGDQSVKIHTLGITTRTPGFIVPTTRQLETYTEVDLTGEGTFVVS
ncbi:hypothetical protein [Archangium violaceum]|uniref:Uncharacterized protein n=1 Tax=Archangium violaceum Cb vi76 TaxID=1406225 RepID=A0A084SQR7_9BACT|nr:hypothetical protein [Archangium violaceum]KFA90802.1 hypothetical protein Q664_26165 [Archangium violaceum Cb vi76]